jgi:uncharacterized protein YutE (UPF0331/DUF86 family)
LTFDQQSVKLKLDKILTSIEILKKGAELKEEEFLRDEIMQLAIERSLQIATQSVIDISTHLIAHHHWGTPETYKDSIEIIINHGVIDKKLGSNLVELVKLRNVIVHVYMDINPKIIYESTERAIKDLNTFVEAIKELL